jgi:hypothetical protein
MAGVDAAKHPTLGMRVRARCDVSQMLTYRTGERDMKAEGAAWSA